MRFKSKNSMFALLFKIIRMYAIVDIAGKQFKVEKNKFLYAPLMDAEAGTSLNFPQVLLTDDDGKVKVGTPLGKRFQCVWENTRTRQRRQGHCFQKEAAQRLPCQKWTSSTVYKNINRRYKIIIKDGTQERRR